MQEWNEKVRIKGILSKFSYIYPGGSNSVPVKYFSGFRRYYLHGLKFMVSQDNI
tara:strand:+ start:1160 stop:1321 length:162 start_codon:yes stop_codon:yes gene_type:complete